MDESAKQEFLNYLQKGDVKKIDYSYLQEVLTTPTLVVCGLYVNDGGLSKKFRFIEESYKLVFSNAERTYSIFCIVVDNELYSYVEIIVDDNNNLKQ